MRKVNEGLRKQDLQISSSTEDDILGCICVR